LELNKDDVLRIFNYTLIALVVALLAGCGAVFINQGAKDATLAMDLAPPEHAKPRVDVKPEQKNISNFEYGDKNINRNLYGKPDGGWMVVTWGANKVSPDFIVEGGADHSQMAAHVFGTLIDRGDSQYPGFMLMGRFKNIGYYDASPFNGIRFFYKCPLEDNSPKHRFSITTAQTVPVANGGTCKRGCWNHYGADLEASDDWQLKSYDFTDLKRESGWGSPVMPPDIVEHLTEFINLQWAHSGMNMPAKYNVDYWVDEVEFF
jgi:hypothetical protein